MKRRTMSQLSIRVTNATNGYDQHERVVRIDPHTIVTAPIEVDGDQTYSRIDGKHLLKPDFVIAKGDIDKAVLAQSEGEMMYGEWEDCDS